MDGLLRIGYQWTGILTCLNVVVNAVLCGCWRYYQMNQQLKQSEERDTQNDEQELSSYRLIKTLGKGNFGKVKLAIHILTGEYVAIKILEKDLIFHKADIERISREIKIMKQARHPHIIQLYEIIENSKKLYLVMEYGEGGDLFDLIVQQQKVEEQRAATIYSQVISGIEYLHSKGITHRDLKPENILISKGLAKIADFGLGNFFKQGEKLQTACGSPCYAAPEMLSKVPYYPQAIDIWSSGILLYTMVAGYLPFEDEVTNKLYEKIKSTTLKYPKSLSSELKGLLRRVLDKNPESRIKIEEIKQEPWLARSFGSLAATEFLVDHNTISYVCELYGIEEANKMAHYLNKNKHNNLTTIYYLAQKSTKTPHLRAHQLPNLSPNVDAQAKLIEESQTIVSKQSSNIDHSHPELVSQHQPNPQHQLNAQQQQQKSENSLEQVFSSDVKTGDDEQYYDSSQILPEQEIPSQNLSVQHQSNLMHEISFCGLDVSERTSQQECEKQSENSNGIQPGISLQQQMAPNYRVKRVGIRQQDKDCEVNSTPMHVGEEYLSRQASQRQSQQETYKSQKQSDEVYKDEMQQLDQLNNRSSVSQKTTKTSQCQKAGIRHQKLETQQQPSSKKLSSNPSSRRELEKQRMKKRERGGAQKYQQALTGAISAKDTCPHLNQKSLSKEHSISSKKLVGKLVPTEPYLIDTQRIVLCSWNRLCALIKELGGQGKVSYYSYSKQCIYLTKVSVTGVRNLGELIQKINAGTAH